MNYNPIKASDLFFDDGAIDALIEKIRTIDKVMDSLDKQSIKVEQTARKQAKAYKNLNATQIQHQEVLEDEVDASAALLKQQTQLQKAREKLAASQSDAAKELARLKEQQRQLNQINRLEAKLNAAKEGSYEALSAQYSLNQIRLKKLTEEQRSNTEEGRQLVEETNAINDALKRMDKTTGVTARNVGNYEDSVRKVLQEQNKLFSELQKTRAEFESLPKSVQNNEKVASEYRATIAGLESELNGLSDQTGQTVEDLDKAANSTDQAATSLEDLPGAAGAASRGLSGLSNSFKALIRNPIIAVIAAIVAGLTALGAAFTRSEKGAALFERASGAINGILSAIVGISVEVAEGISDAFNDPLGFVEKLGTAIKDNVINRFEAVIELGGAVGSAIKAAFSLDGDALSEAANKAGTALVKLGTGFDADQQKDFADGVKDLTKDIIDQADSFAELARRRRQVARENRALVRTIEEATTEEEKFRAIADDITRSFAEREAAAERTRKATEERARTEIQLAKNNLDLISQEIRLREANGENIEAQLDQQLQAFQTLAQAERDYTLTLQENERQRRELVSDRLERDLDILIDGFDNQKTINERLINDEEITLDRRRQIFEDTAALANESFEKQLETIQGFTKESVDLNDLVNTSDATTLNNKIRALGLSEIAEGRLLEIVRERRIALQDLNDIEKDLLDATLERANEEGVSLQQREQYLQDYVVAIENQLARAKQAAEGQENAVELIAIAEEKYNARLKKAAIERQNLRKEDLDNRIEAINREEQILINNATASIKIEEDKQRAIFKIQVEALKKRIALLESAGTTEATAQAELLKSELQVIESEIGAFEKEIADKADDPKSIYEILGFDFSDKQEEALNTAFANTKQQLLELANLRTQLAQQATQRADTEVAEAQRALDAEIANRNAGFAHEVDTAKKRLAEAKKNQEEALKEQERAQRQQQIINAATQASNLLVASSNILKQFTPLAAIPILALMWGTFIGAQARAAQITKRTFGEGGFEVVGGGTHASGNDTPLGFDVNGQPAYVERGEGVAVIRRSQMKKAGKFTEEFTNKVNAGRLTDGEIRAMSEVMNGKVAREINSYPIRTVNEVQYILQPGGPQVNTSVMESELRAIRKQGETQYDSQGRRVKWGNVRYVYST
jgi:hypothetical protein